jgi:cytochrome c biogenesis protein CcmG/thiol:disulfide interchange protein DsbE
MSKRPAPRPKPAARRSGSWWWIAGLGLVVIIGVIAVVVSRGDKTESSASAGEVADSVKVEGTALPPLPDSGDDPAVGKTAPTLIGRNFAGDSVTIGPGSRKLVALVAHWCPHCQAEVPRLVEADKAGAFSGTDLFAVATGTRSDADNYPPSAWLESVQWPGKILLDTANSDAAQAYGLTSYPFLVLLDAQNKVIARTSGERTAEQLTAFVQDGTVPDRSGASSGA